MKKHTVIFILIFIYIIGISGYGYYSYFKTEKDIMSGINKKLRTASFATTFIIGEDYHDNIIDENSISKEKYLENAKKMSEYANLIGIKYIYTFIKDSDSKIVRFTSTSYSKEEFENNEIPTFYSIYEEDPSPAILEAFIEEHAVFENVTDKWGTFRSVFIPIKTKNNRIYITGADLDISYVKGILNRELFRAILTGLFFILLLIPVIFLYIRSMEKEKRVLELKVEERTKELQNEHQKLVQAKKKITDNINFSAMIQNSILPLHNPMNDFFDDYFVIWEPKDIVGGDIYLFEEFEDGCLIVVADCMGHGVTGAFMTMITKAAFSSILHKTNYNNPALILSELNIEIKILLKQDRKDAKSNTGLDAAVVFYDKKNQKVIFASAKTPIFYIQNEKLEVTNGDRHSIGYKRSRKDFKFTNYEINVEKEFYFYITTDGIIDQYGGDSKLTFGKDRLKNLLFANYKDSFSNQKDKILYELKNYQKNYERNDDITIFGFKLKN